MLNSGEKTIEERLGIPNGSIPRMIMHPARRHFLASRRRFDVIAAGRRSGKTVEGRTRLQFGSFHLGGNHHGCLTPPVGVADPTFVYAAPTYNQAKKVVWEKFKYGVPAWAIDKKSESDLSITYVTGSKLYVVGMDRPERVEGIAIDGVVLDEFADMNPLAWTSSIRPALSTPGRPPGWALFIGRPRGRNHFWRLFERAKRLPDWDVHHPWPSTVVMAPDEIEAARRDLDDRSFRQEYLGEFLSDAGQAYYQFSEDNIADVQYEPHKALQLAFDFNVRPGVALVCQDIEIEIDAMRCYSCGHPAPGRSGSSCPTCRTPVHYETGTKVIDEIYVADGSNTRRVCEAVIKEWKHHKGNVVCYGDATGGARRTSGEGSDWQIIEEYLGAQWPLLALDIPSVNPLTRDRIVAMNSRFKNSIGLSRILINPTEAPRLIEDCEQTMLKPSGDLDEGKDKMNTHLTDALGYLICTRFESGAREELELEEI